MISDKTRKLLSIAAKRNNFGGRVYTPKIYTDEELIEIAKMYSSKNTLSSVFTKKEHVTLQSWKNEIGQKVDDSCRYKLYYYIDFYKDIITSCPYCLQKKTIECYRKKTKYCSTCTAAKVWKYGPKPARGPAISAAKKKWYQTDDGIAFALTIGITNSKKLKEYYQTDAGKAAAKKSSIVNKRMMNERILSGAFTPNSNNRNTHWESCYNGKRYRSSWEAIYQSFNPDDLYEQLRIVYTINGNQKIYILDFINHTSKVVTEVKPRELCNGEVFDSKMQAINEWCSANGYRFQLVDLDFLKSLKFDRSMLDKFDNNTQRKILKIYETIKN